MSSKMQYSLEQVQQWSPFVEQKIQRFPELLEQAHWQELWAEGELYQRVYQQIMNAVDEEELKTLLRQIRNWQMGRIAIRDLSGLASLQEVMLTMSDLADALVTSALDWHYERLCLRYGTPYGRESGLQQKMLVIGMGKLGGQELNFSSDIDLIFAYPEGGETRLDEYSNAKRTITNDLFFTRLGQALNKSLTETTGDGFVYRVDMRLRPFGDAGPLAVTFASLEHYYELHGRAWERYALVKARVMAGDATDAKYMFDILRPFIYRRYVDFSAMDSLRELKQMIAAQVKKKGMKHNIKLGPGGIREIEFIAQAFQLVHGGRDKTLQSRSLLTTLQVLEDNNFLEEESHQDLRSAYVFLRRAENRLQEWRDQQTHSLPSEPHQQLMLANSMGFSEYSEFMVVLSKHLEFVQGQFNEVFAEDEVCESQDRLSELWLSDLEDVGDLSDQNLPVDKAAHFLKVLRDFKDSRTIKILSREGALRLNATMPLLMQEVLKPEYSEQSLTRVLSVIEAIAKRSVYLVMLKENPESLAHLVKLCDVSAWLTEMLVKYPALLDQLLDERTLYAPLEASALQHEALALLDSTGQDEELFMNQIREWRHAQVFKVAAADITGHLPVTKVSDYLTWIAEAVLNATVEFAWQMMQERSGLPGGMTEANKRNPFMVLGYGKVGGIELGYGSDLDIVFVYEGLNSSDQAVSLKGKSLDNAIYFVRMGQKIISLMTTLMPSGVLYEVDTRLRPNGVSGMMVVDFEGYKNYLENKAWTWESQAFVRVRAVVGDAESVAAFEVFKTQFLCKERSIESLRTEVVDMRLRMQNELDKSNDELFDLKQGRGGIVDIEFMVQFLVLAYAHQYPNLSVFSDNLRILEAIAEAKLLSLQEVDGLLEAYKVYRSKYHRVALQKEKYLVASTCYQVQREVVQSVWNKLMLG
ncbi:bifunctional [glutamate--ammonia ligase]-adenylyl-L-tyrosine phosphorylase/[glutamate--ammonia-ligase] adenylyltransferase [Thiomicrorhabdus arctica]|uniref:bifunctional [glutamate--ammonia ligase]-adenylyl-L-tyrosine phosphorylase/[glutamate--ammonia-ligase] adenylyltransferase n=1 Tax=Thiomicrorhabdus arctica TaxID=131540 RepID=UPI0003791225|nr:bifunctional [glutamate--ammonia ligase]-adenylyl-L-tyrosine phosphorylase/[glutamate--ammonia-ligase] adenylyltransferase [Thiomicrorhabdus arctica]